jgi:hypothetical protein
MADVSQPPTTASMPVATPSSETAPALDDEVSAFAFHSSHHVIANAMKIVTKGVTTTNMPAEPEIPHSPKQNGPLFKLSTELRLEICRFAIQHALDLVSPPPNTNYKYSSLQTTRGALALLYTCKTLRAESIDAMEPLVNASKHSLQSEIDLAYSRRYAAVQSTSGSHAKFYAYASFDSVLLRLGSSMTGINEVCSVLAFAREADKKVRSGDKTDRAQLGSLRKRKTQTIISNGQWVL